MQGHSLPRRLAAEALGTALLLAAAVGSGIMAQRLAGGNVAIALLCNTIATGAALTVLILIFGPLSGAHFNPMVSAAFAARRDLAWRDAALYITAQVAGGIAGVWLAHADTPGFVTAQLIGGAVALKVGGWLWHRAKSSATLR